MKNIYITWDKDDTLMDNLANHSSKRKGLDLRIYQTNKTISIDKVSDKIFAIAALDITESSILKAVIAFFFIISLSPYDFKIMKGNGIDNIIDLLKVDEEKNYLYVEAALLETELHKLNLGIKSLEWFRTNNLFELEADKYIFRGNKIESAKIYQSLD